MLYAVTRYIVDYDIKCTYIIDVPYALMLYKLQCTCRLTCKMYVPIILLFFTVLSAKMNFFTELNIL